MAWPTPALAVAGSVLTAAWLNTNLRSIVSTLYEYIWPVGSIFEATVSTNPGTLLGFGTWTAFGAGRVTVGIDAGQTEFDTVEETGGAKTHTLTVGEIPAHDHDINTYQSGAGGGATDIHVGNGGDPYENSAAVRNTGGGGAHNNLQPYIVVYRWKRTA